MRITRKDIAAAAGVSASTVGMILSGKGEHYNPDTRQLVLETAEKLGYQPSINARALRLQRSLLIGVMLNEVNAHLSARFLMGVQQALRATDYSPVVFFTGSEEEQDQCLAQCINRQVDAILLNCVVDPAASRIASFSKHVAALKIPIMETFGRFLRGIPSSNVDNPQGGRLATRHLIGLGHRRIALLTHSRHGNREIHSDAWGQAAGYREAMETAGLEPLFITPDVDFEKISIENFMQAGYAALEMMSSLPERPTAVVCYADVMAYGLNRACRHAGLRVPEDLSIVGGLDMFLSTLVNPPLTTCQVDFFQMGRAAADQLLGAIRGEPMGDCLMEFEMVIRQSAGPVHDASS